MGGTVAAEYADASGLTASSSTAQWLRTFAIITTEANELVGTIHHRKPLIIAPEDYARWLSDEPDPRDLLRPFPSEPIAPVADLDAGEQARA
jgi:putative SOS response-associated peptidase YedK